MRKQKGLKKIHAILLGAPYDVDIIRDVPKIAITITGTSFAHENMEYKWAIQDEIIDILAGGYGCDAYYKDDAKQ